MTLKEEQAQFDVVKWHDSIEVGKDGDVVIWTADPITVVGASAYLTVVDGKIVHQM